MSPRPPHPQLKAEGQGNPHTPRVRGFCICYVDLLVEDGMARTVDYCFALARFMADRCALCGAVECQTYTGVFELALTQTLDP